mmetsp:Transcript_52552/g.94325  ORF Transcript_52552/g.94325 Transcript_52552/m.94325 type:complete len:1146 (+) Transcript_52552:68-3505(+)
MGGRASKEDDDTVSEVGSEFSGSSTPREKNKNVTPKAEVMSTDFSSKIIVTFRCEGLVRGKNTICVIYSKWSGEPFWSELGVTEICGQETNWPVWEKPFDLEFRVEAVRLIRCEVYVVRKQHMIEDLMEQKFVGSAEFVLTEAMMARADAKNNGWLVKKMESHTRKKNDPQIGKICAFAEESLTAKKKVFFKVRGTGISSTDLWKRRADPYFVVNRADKAHEDGELVLQPVFRSEVARSTSEPQYNQCRITAAQSCGCLIQQDIIITVMDWFRLGEDQYIGEVVLNFEELEKAAARGAPMTLPICRRDGPRLMGLTRVVTSKSQLRSATKSSRSGSRSTSGSNRGRPSKDSGSGSGKSPGHSKDGSGLGGLLKGRRSSSLSSSGSRSDSEDGRPTRKGSNSSRGASKSTASSGSQNTHNTANSKGSKPGIFGTVVGHLTLEEFGLTREYSFLDYIRGGLELRLNLGIDFTRSNLGQYNPESSHSMVHKDEDTAYATCIRALGEVIQTYDTDDMYPVYGFGAKIPPSHSVCSNCFALTGDFFLPEVEGIDGILKAYHRALHVCHLHGPSHLSEVVRLIANLARPYVQIDPGDPRLPWPEMKFFVMLILTDGEIADQEQVVREIRDCTELPLTIIFVGIGNKDFTFLRELADDMKHMLPKPKDQEDQGPGFERSLMKFICFNDFRDDPQKLAAATLSHLPQEVVRYYQDRGIKPRDLKKFEDDAGNPVEKHIPKEPPMTVAKGKKQKASSGESKSASQSRAGTQSRSATRTSVSGDGSRSSKSPGHSKSPGESRSGSHETSSSGSSRGLTLANHDMSDTSSESETDNDALFELMDEDEEEQKRLEKKERNLNNLPIFLSEEKERLVEDGVALGYEKAVILRVIRDGIPSSGLDVLVDNILNGGYGKSPSYKEAALQAMPDEGEEMEQNLPGQVDDKSPSAASPSSRRQSVGAPTVDYAATLNALAKMSQKNDKAQSQRLSLVSMRRSSVEDNSMPTSPIVQSARPTSSSSSIPQKDPWANVKIEDGSAARTLLEVSASRSREASKELGNKIRTTSKTLEEVAGRLGRLRTLSKGLEGGRRPSLGQVQFNTITEDVDAAEEPEMSFGPRAAGSDSPADMAKTMPEGNPWLTLKPSSSQSSSEMMVSTQ